MLGPLRLLLRGLTLRCPRCGASFLSGMRLRTACAGCGLPLQPGDGDELGSVALNIVLGEGVFIGGLLAAILLTMPTPPWDAILCGGIAGAVLMPLLFYPVSKTLWLALHLVMRGGITGPSA